MPVKPLHSPMADPRIIYEEDIKKSNGKIIQGNITKRKQRNTASSKIIQLNT